MVCVNTTQMYISITLKCVVLHGTRPMHTLMVPFKAVYKNTQHIMCL